MTARDVEFLDARDTDARDRCGVADASGYVTPESVVPLGERFRCVVSANTDEVYEVQVQCPGYAPLDVLLPVGSCAGLFGGCDDIDMGTLVVRR